MSEYIVYDELTDNLFIFYKPRLDTFGNICPWVIIEADNGWCNCTFSALIPDNYISIGVL